MSDEQQQPAQQEKRNRKLGKVRNIQTKNGVMQKIYLDNLNHLNQDGTPNQYYKGALVWIDAETGEQFQVKQLSLWVPKKGMSANEVERGCVANVSINIDDSYETTKIE